MSKKPIVVAEGADAAAMNREHGEAYGVDWAYPEGKLDAIQKHNQHEIDAATGLEAVVQLLFVTDPANDPAAKQAAAAYAEACHAKHPELSRDIVKRWLTTPDAEKPKAPSVARAVSNESQWRNLWIAPAKLIALGISGTAVATMTAGDPKGVLWHKLARMDGMLALASLPPEMLADITAELMQQGCPVPVNSAADIAHFLIISADAFCPRDSWATHALRSAVATAILLRLAEDAWASKIVIAKPTQH